jgi:hypothetical protein
MLKPESIKDKILAAAKERGDLMIIKRLEMELDLFSVNARYHPPRA